MPVFPEGSAAGRSPAGFPPSSLLPSPAPAAGTRPTGAWRTLTLRGEERDLFDGDRQAARERELGREVVSELAPGLAREVFSRVERETR